MLIADSESNGFKWEADKIWVIEKCVRKYREDGELLDDWYTEVEQGEY